MDGITSAEPPDVLDAQAIRSSHRERILEALWSLEGASRAELARMTGFSRSTVSAIVQDLLDAELLSESQPVLGAGGGRPPTLLRFRPDARIMLGLEIGGRHISCALVDMHGRVIAHESRDAETRIDPRVTADVAIEMARTALARAGGRRLLGVGVALPSPVLPSDLTTLDVIMPAWSGFRIDEVIGQALSAPVFIDNDANAGMRAEARWGAARGLQHAAFVKVATGVGAGLMLSGRMFSGHRGIAGELGHMSIDANGPPCVCGLNGCLNVVVGTEALLGRCRVRRARYPDSMLAHGELSVPRLVEAAKEKDPLSLEVVGYAGATLGVALANVFNLLNLERVILGGRLAEVGSALLEPLEVSLSQRALSPAIADAVVSISQVEHTVSVGAACLVLDAALAERGVSLFRKDHNAA